MTHNHATEQLKLGGTCPECSMIQLLHDLEVIAKIHWIDKAPTKTPTTSVKYLHQEYGLDFTDDVTAGAELSFCEQAEDDLESDLWTRLVSDKGVEISVYGEASDGGQRCRIIRISTETQVF